jgi:hypothetical protein
MRRTKLSFYKFHLVNLAELAAAAILLMGCFPARSVAQQAGQKTFSSAEEASHAFATAVGNNDEKAMIEILGPDAKRIVWSGDEAEDAENRANFAQRYQEMHRLVQEPDGTTTLYIGAMNWPTPIPIVNKGNLWYFDTDAGKKEILYRRVGRNEMSAIRVCQQLVAAQKEYSAEHKDYAPKFMSDEGKHNGLYWKAANGEPQSPVGPLVAMAAAEGSGSPTPYRGYYYRILAKGNGFVFVAYPAEYRSSGVMTFVVGEDGVVYQKDLGKSTAVVAKAMKEYHSNAGWQKAEEQPEETAGEQKTK